MKMTIDTFIDVSQLKPIRFQKPNWSDEGKEMPVYKIKISELHYNDENGRIATWISGYENDPEKPSLHELERDEYNDTIERFIRNSNTADSFKALVNDIKKKTQLNPGVVLSNGMVVSGNRRFTALRTLYNETADEKYEYFECFVIDVPETKADKEFVKLIETKTQFSVVTEEDYNPIDRLVTIYMYLINETTKIWSVKEYAKKIGMKESEAFNWYYRAKIMVDFLEFINEPLQFHIARIKKLDGPIADLAGIYKKLSENNPGEWKRIRPLFFSEMNKGSGDRTREVRKLKKIYADDKSEFEILLAKFYNKQEEVEEKRKSGEIIFTSVTKDEKTGEEKALVSLDDNEITKSYVTIQKTSAREKQLKRAQSAFGSLSDIETDTFSRMTSEEKQKLDNELDRVLRRASYLKDRLNK